MKTTRIRAGEYTFTNDHGFSGEILKQPEGGWSVYDPNAYQGRGDTLDFFMTKAEAVGFASGINADGNARSRV